MARPTDITDASADDLRAIVLATLGKEEASITRMLQCIAEQLDGFCCGLWEVPNSNVKINPPKGFLLTVATWSKANLFAMDDVPLDNSPTASVAVSQQGLICHDIQKDGGAKKGHPYWRRHNVRGMCVAPIKFLDDNLGALNVYRCEGQPAFTSDEQRRLENMAALVPGLYRAVREKIGLHLVSDVEKVLRVAEGKAKSSSRAARRRLSEREIKRVLNDVCRLAAKAFNCVETSLFLEEPNKLPGTTYECIATSNAKSVKRKVYHAENDKGRLTGWVLANWQPLQILDLANFDRDWEFLQGKYPGLDRRSHGEEDKKNVKRLLKLKKGDALPPLSLMIVPVFGGQDWFGETELRGVMRCYLARSGPYYFSEREVNLLGVVAAQVGQWWARWRTRGELEQENEVWNTMVERLGGLNTFVRQEFSKQNPDEGAIFREALRLTSAVIPGAELNSIRMFDSNSNELRFVEFSPDAEAELNKLKLNKQDLRKFKVEPRSKYAGVRVFVSGKPWEKPNAHASKLYHPIFADVKHMVIVPIGVEHERFGLLDLRWTTKSIPPYAIQAATLLGQQIGIYHQLALMMAKQQEAIAKAKQLQLEEANANEDFTHQLRTPIASAIMSADLALDAMGRGYDRRPLYMVRGLIRRAERVSMSMRLLSELSHGRPVTLNRHQLDCDSLLKKLIALADDAQLLNEERRIIFSVERDGFRPSLFRGLSADSDLLEQMISNLLDNAGKYSRRNSAVRIFSGVSGTGRIYLAVANDGLAFKPGEAEESKKRGWRSPDAKLIAREGRGIGLWLVDAIMKAHGGDLQIISPNRNRENEIRLAFLPQP